MNKWILGARPRTLAAAIAPVLVAIALVGKDFDWLRAVLALMVAVWLQIGVNFANDYSDGVKGTDADRVGPIRLVASGLATAKSVQFAALISFVAYFFCRRERCRNLVSPFNITSTYSCRNFIHCRCLGLHRRKESIWLPRPRRIIGFSFLRSYCNYGYLLCTN